MNFKILITWKCLILKLQNGNQLCVNVNSGYVNISNHELFIHLFIH